MSVDNLGKIARRYFTSETRARTRVRTKISASIDGSEWSQKEKKKKALSARSTPRDWFRTRSWHFSVGRWEVRERAYSRINRGSIRRNVSAPAVTPASSFVFFLFFLCFFFVLFRRVLFFVTCSPARIYEHLMCTAEKHDDAYGVGVPDLRNESNASRKTLYICSFVWIHCAL